ncbi:cell division inhibitor SulA [Thalassolituus marinus]|uniref:Cell division inhibitor SulA n=1 Tax=Thalassolituus marinus TaxID=671053 RepID=A0ABS7ZRY1_9GAMM|nr:SulA-like leucine-rich domain-containing protein [Thalassolituus marinus]MCA6064008.1 hypothetical protein [Thalassolituus marinus]
MRQLALGMEEPGLSFSSQSPQRSLPAGSMTEVIVGDESAIQPLHLLPLLARCNEQKRWLMWLSPNRPLNKQWLETMGLQQSPVIHMDLCAETQMALCCRILEAGNSHMIVEWDGLIGTEQRRHLRQLARETGSHIVLIQRDL